MEFKAITAAVLVQNRVLFNYLNNAHMIRRSDRGDGAFVSNADVAPQSLEDFGKLFSKGGMIIPNRTPEFIKKVLDDAEKMLNSSNPRAGASRTHRLSGKTSRDRESGAAARQAQNRAKRAEENRNRLSPTKNIGKSN